ARDVVYSLDRLIHGRPEERLEMRGYALYISEVTAVGPLTVRVRTSRPLSILLNKLRFVAIVPEGATTASLETRTDRTGPYKLVEWQRGKLLRLVRNEDYWATRAALARVEIQLDRSPDAAVKDMLEGRSQLAQCNSRKAEAAVRDSGRFDLERRPSLF